MNYVKRFNEFGCKDLLQVGGKAANLGELVANGFNVPEGFCITTQAYRYFVNANGLNERIISVSTNVQADQMDSLEKASSQIQEAFTFGVIPEELESEINSAYCNLCGMDACGNNQLSVAVRSSATAEDLENASFAGQQDTYLNVVGVDGVTKAVQKCWASLWTSRAIGYRCKEEIAPAAVELAVVVQKMIASEVSGVLFTMNPVTNAKDEVLINSAWGIGEAIVGGLVTPDQFILNKLTGQVKEANIADKTVMTVRLEEGTQEQPVPDDKRSIPTLSNAQLHELNQLAVAIEQHYKRPMDIEWALQRGKLYVLQGRPVTTLQKFDGLPDLFGMDWSRKTFIERFPDPLTPFTWSTLKTIFPLAIKSNFKALGIEIDDSQVPLVNKYYERFYVNDTLFSNALHALPFTTKESNDTKRENDRPSKSSIAKKIATIVRVIRLVYQTSAEWEKMHPAFVNDVKRECSRPWESMKINELLDGISRHDMRFSKAMINHVKSVTLAEVTVEILRELTRKWLADEDGSIAIALLSGFEGNLTIETNQALWKLSEAVTKSDRLKDAIRNNAGANWKEKLSDSEDERDFLLQWNEFLDNYGHRSMHYELACPTWKENPEQVIELLKVHLAGKATNPMDNELKNRTERQKKEEECLKRLSVFKRVIFKQALGKAQTYTMLRENQQFIITEEKPLIRRIALSIARRFCDAKLLQEPEDIFYLEKDEIIALAKILSEDGTATVSVSVDTAEFIEKRKSLYQQAYSIMPSLYLGSTKRDNPAEAKKALSGIPASKGIAKGKACIVKSPEDFCKVQKGSIIVAQTTSPAWTPLFCMAAGLVSEYGGVLSHAGVVAREYGIPAVLGVSQATILIHDGELIHVNADTGEVSHADDVGIDELS